MSGAGAPGAVEHAALFRDLPTAYLVMNPDLVIVDANAAYCALLGRTREELVGVPVFEAFPPSEADLAADGTNPLRTSFERARDTGVPDVLSPFRYDVQDPRTGRWRERTWSLITAPVEDADGRPRWLLQRVEDITDYVLEREERRAGVEQERRAQERVEAVEAELYLRAQELRDAQEARERAVRRLAALVETASALTAAQSLVDVEEVAVGGLAAVGADGGGLVTRSPDGSWRAAPGRGPGAAPPAGFVRAASDSPAPACWSARTGQRLLLATPAAARALGPSAVELVEVTGYRAWAFVPLVLGERRLGCLTVAWTAEHACTREELRLLEALAAQCAQALGRVLAARAEREAAAAVAALSEALQGSLLTEPAQPEGARIAVRYRPAAQHARVGGDWYDAFSGPDGATSVLVGDASGHDREAVAVMAQLRNLVRGIDHALDAPPSRVLSALDAAVRDLRVGALATLVLAQLLPAAPGAAGRAPRRVVWSNAGHPPPVLVVPGVGAELVSAPPELLLGVDPAAVRSDHEALLPPGATLLLYSDGLVERRDRSLREGLAALVTHVDELAHHGPEELCDGLLARMLPEDPEDDVVLLALRVLDGEDGGPAVRRREGS